MIKTVFHEEARLKMYYLMKWRRKWLPTPVLLPEKFHGQKSLVGYSPWGCKELDTTEQLHFSILRVTALPTRGTQQ